MEIFFGKKKKVDEPILPTTEYIYELLFVEILKKIKSLENEYIYKTSKKINDKDLIKKIEKNIIYLNILFIEKKTNNCINSYIQIDNNGVPVEPLSPSNPNQNMGIKQNQFVIFIDYFKIYWIICEIVEKWLIAGGNLSHAATKDLDKYELIKFLNELNKGFSTINKTVINEKINQFIDLLDIKQKKRYYSFEIYSILKKKDLNTTDLEELKKYYDLEIDYTLLDEYKLTKMFEGLEKLYLDKDVSIIKKSDLEDYSKIIKNINNLSSNKKEKINDYYKKYYVYKLNYLLSNLDYKNKNKEIFEYIDKLEQLGYILNSKQKKRLEIFKLKLTPTQIQTNLFDENIWFPLFAKGELECIKTAILSNPNDSCKIIKKLFPFYKISNDYFCEKINPRTNNKLYNNQEDINTTINTQCIIMLLVGIINSRLHYTKQDYQIIMKGGKTLQILLSKFYGEQNKNTNIDYKSSDIDLIINPIDGVKYDKQKCKILTEIFVNLIKWIINQNDNPYNPYNFNNYISSEQGREYPDIIKISHKIQKDNSTFQEVGYTSISDIDFGEKNHLMYDNLISDWEITSKYGKLLYIYQNLNDYLLEKLHYLNYYVDEMNKLLIKSNTQDIKLNNDETKNLNNYKRFVNKFSKQISYIIKMEFDKKNIVNDIENNIHLYLDNFAKKNNIEINVDKIINFLN